MAKTSDLPPPPPGADPNSPMTPIGAAGGDMPPPPPGADPDSPMTPLGDASASGVGGTVRGAAQGFGKALQQPESFTGSMRKLGSDIWRGDPKAVVGDIGTNWVQAARDVPEAFKNIGLGALGSLSGLAELDPFGSKAPDTGERLASKVSRELKAAETSPGWAKVGDLGAQLLGGEALGAGKLIGKGVDYLAPKAAEGASVLPKLVSGAGRGALTGGTYGVLSGLDTPTGDPDMVAALKKKGKTAAEEGLGGALLGGGLGLAGNLASEGSKAYGKAAGKEANAAAEALRAKTEGRVSAASEKESAAAETAGWTAASKEAEARAHEIELAKMKGAEERLQRPLGTPGGEAPKTPAAAPKTADEAADRLALQIASEKGMSGKDFGGRVQKLAEDLREKYTAKRTQESGLKEALEKYGDEPRIDTSTVRPILREARSRTANPAVRAWLDKTEKEIESEMRTGEVTATVRRVSGHRLESLRKVLDTAIRTGEVQEAGGIKTDVSEVRHYLQQMRSALMKSAEASAPDYTAALKRYATLSRDLDIFERKGVLSSALKSDVYSGEPLAERAEVIGKLLSKTAKGNTVLERLMKEDPSLQADARRYFQTKLFGESGRGEAVSPERLRKFLVANKEALEQTGLFQEFEAKAANVEKALGRLKEDAEAKVGLKKEAESAQKEALAQHEASNKLRSDFERMKVELDAKNLPAAKVATQAKSAARKLYESKHISLEDYDAMIEDINSVSSKVEDAAKAKAHLKHIIGYGLGALVAAGAGTEAARYIHYRVVP